MEKAADPLLLKRQKRCCEKGNLVSVASEAGFSRMIAAQPISSQRVVLVDEPVQAMQTYQNRKDVRCCHCCLSFVGTLADQVCHLVGRQVSGLPTASSICLRLEEWEETKEVQCPKCYEIYCSAECLEQEHRGSWGWLCEGAGLAWKEYTWEAEQAGSEYYELVARIIMGTLYDIAQGGTTSTEELGSLLGFAQVDWAGTLVQEGGDGNATDRAALSHALELQVVRMAAAARNVWAAACSHHAAEWWEAQQRDPAVQKLLSKDLFTQLIGAVRCNAQSVTGPSLLVPYITEWAGALEFNGLSAEETEASGEALCNVAAAIRERAGIEEGGSVNLEELLPSSMGIALFLLQSSANHSCLPNVFATYPELRARAVCVQLQAIRAMCSEEEVTFSYIDETAPLLERQSALQRDYGFRCKCPRCEEAEGIPGGELWDAGDLCRGRAHTRWQLQCALAPEIGVGQAVIRSIYDTTLEKEIPNNPYGDSDEWEGGVAPEGLAEVVVQRLQNHLQLLTTEFPTSTV